MSGKLLKDPWEMDIVTLCEKDAGLDDDGKVVEVASVDTEFLEAYGIDLIEGRKFDKVPILYNIDRFRPPSLNEPETFATTILNKKAVEYLGFNSPKEAIGEIVDFGQQRPDFVTHMQIIGVMPDVNFGTMREEIAPTMFYLYPDAITRSHFFSMGATQRRL